MTLPKIFKTKLKDELLQQAIDLKENGQIAESIKKNVWLHNSIREQMIVRKSGILF